MGRPRHVEGSWSQAMASRRARWSSETVLRLTGMEAVVTAKSDHASAAGVLGVEQRVTIGVPLFAVDALPAPQGGFAGKAGRQRGS